MDEQIFSDGIGAITAISGTVRLDFVTFSPTQKDAKGQPAMVFCQRVVMSVEAFLLAADKIHEVAGALAGSGLRPRAETPIVERPAPVPERPPRPVSEPAPPSAPPPARTGTPFP